MVAKNSIIQKTENWKENIKE